MTMTLTNLLVDPGADYLWLCRDDQSEGARDQGVISDRIKATVIPLLAYTYMYFLYFQNLRVIVVPL